MLPSLSPHIVKASEITEKTTGAVPSASSFCNISSDTRRHTLHGNGRAKTAILTNTQASPAMSAIRSSSGSAGDICVDSTRGGNGPRSTVSSEHWQADEFAARRSDGSIEGNWSKVFGAGLGPDWAAMFNDQEAPENSGGTRDLCNDFALLARARITCASFPFWPTGVRRRADFSGDTMQRSSLPLPARDVSSFLFLTAIYACCRYCFASTVSLSLQRSPVQGCGNCDLFFHGVSSGDLAPASCCTAIQVVCDSHLLDLEDCASYPSI